MLGDGLLSMSSEAGFLITSGEGDFSSLWASCGDFAGVAGFALMDSLLGVLVVSSGALLVFKDFGLELGSTCSAFTKGTTAAGATLLAVGSAGSVF